MEELKTLKDWSVEEWKDRKEFVELWVKVDELKQEAIKWIKHFDVVLGGDSHEAKWIKNFFNISNEDLK